MSSFVDLKEFLVGYLAETDEHMSASNAHLVALEAAARRGEHNPRAVRGLFRSLHTIKGLSAMVGVEPVVDLAHGMEALLRVSERRGGALSPRALELLGEGLTGLEQRVRAFGASRTVPAAPRELLDSLAAVEVPDAGDAARERLNIDAEVGDKLGASERQQIAAALAAGQRVVRLEFLPSPARAATGVNITSVRERVGSLGEIVKVIPLSRPEAAAAPTGLVFALVVITEASEEALIAAAGGPPAKVLPVERSETLPPAAPEPELPEPEPSRGGFVRVPVARLDEALEKLSALVVNRYRLGRTVAAMAEAGVDVRGLREVIAESARQLRDLRAAILQARTVAAAEVLERVPLLVRGLERTTRKRVNLDLVAGRAELDKAVAERLFSAIVHLVRNAVDHGLESPAERARLGKPAEGMLRLTCTDLSNDRLELTIADDGRGIDVARLAARAGRPVPSNDDELMDLLSIPGISTREQADTTSGRGMGIDIVHRIVSHELGGELSVRTVAGQGTTFVARVPLSITILDAFSFVCADQPFVVPVSSVEEIIDVDAVAAVAAPNLHKTRRAGIRLLDRRGEATPLVRLAELLEMPAVHGERPKALVVRRGQQPYAFEVDRMLGQQEVVVRPLADALVKVPGVSGAVDLGDGRPTLMLDLLALSARLAMKEAVA